MMLPTSFYYSSKYIMTKKTEKYALLAVYLNSVFQLYF